MGKDDIIREELNVVNIRNINNIMAILVPLSSGEGGGEVYDATRQIEMHPFREMSKIIYSRIPE